MSPPLDDRYLSWLQEQVGPRDGTRSTHWELLKQLYTKEFVWIVPNDDNRVEDGRDLRHEFVAAFGMKQVDASWMGLPCSVLELIIGLSRRLSFEAEGEPREWFWHLLDNLDIARYHDRRYGPRIAGRIDDKLDALIWRLYAPDGQGGLFPLKHPVEDQREVELWYQLSAYILELN